jgi:ABC-2 type transport system ATP-binding protein
VTVLGGQAAGSPEALNRVAFVAQDVPLYKHLPVRDMMHVARALNGRRWDQRRADRQLAALDIPLRRKVGKLSGGQQAQVALTIALARRPELLLLDEPLAHLDPLARHEFLAALMETVAEDGTSVLFSSHVVAELERIADYLVVLARGQVQVAGDVETLLAGHQILTGPAADAGTAGAQLDVVHAQLGSAQAHLVIRRSDAAAQPPAGWQAQPVTLEELMLAYLREPGASALPGPEPRAAGAFTGASS